MRIIAAIVSIGVLCAGITAVSARASGPRNLRVTPGGSEYSIRSLILLSDAERKAQIEAIEKIHGLDEQEAGLVLFARMAEAEKESAMTESLIAQWLAILADPAAGQFADVPALVEHSDLSEAEARLVVLFRRTASQPEKSQAVTELRMKLLTELTDRAVENDKTAP